MKGQATVEFLMIFLVTMAAILMIFYPVAKAHLDFRKQSDFIEKKQELEDFLVGFQIYCNGGVGTSVVGTTGSTGCDILPYSNKIKFRCGQTEQEFPGFFEGCVMSNAKKPV